jgi:hypothetical protein
MGEVSVRAGRSGEDLLGWLYRRHLEVFEMENMFGHVETALRKQECIDEHLGKPRGVPSQISRDTPG